MTHAALRPRGALTLALLLALVASPGCAVGNYLGERGLDLTDILDIKYGTSIGVGGKVELTHFLGAGAGVSALGVQREWYGRRSIKSKGFAFAHAGAIGVDGGYGTANPDGWSDERADVYLLLVNGTAYADFMAAPGGTAEVEYIGEMRNAERIERDEPAWPPTPPLGTRWRFGAEVLLPGGNFGIYLNLGELVDFLVGFTTIDIMDDDGYGKGELYELPPRSEPRDETVF